MIFTYITFTRNAIRFSQFRWTTLSYRPATLSPGHAPLHFLGEDFLTKPEKDCIRDSGAEEMFAEPVFIEVDA